jgi:hypothetical protein
MADYEFPPDLLDAQRTYWTADARVQEVTDALPSSVAVVAGEAGVTEEQQAELVAVRAERLLALEALNQHPWWETTEDRYAAWKALQKASEA